MRVSDERGWAIVGAIALMSAMLGLGLALLAIVDTQAHQTRTERAAESAYNLAEGGLNAEAFLLSRSWPTTNPGGSSSCSTTASISGDLTTEHAVQKILARTFTSNDYAAGATWKLNVCDDTGATGDTWTESKLSNAQGYDQNNNGRVWVRAQAVAGSQKRAVAGLVTVQRPPVLPTGYAILNGGISGQLSWATSQLTGGALLGDLTSGLLGNNKLVRGGKVGIRCGLTTLCVDGVFAGLSPTPLKNLLLANDVIQYGSPSAVSDEVLADLRRQAQAAGTYYETLAAAASCLPAGTTTGSIIFIDQVGNGQTDYCNITTTTNPVAAAVIVASGRIRITGSGTFTAVVYGANRQRGLLGDDRSARNCSGLANLAADPCEVVRVEAGSKVSGAVFSDGATGDVALYPSHTPSGGSCTKVNLINLGALIPAGSTLLSTSVSVCGDNVRTLLDGGSITVTVTVSLLGVPVNVSVPVSLANVSNPSDLVTTLMGDVGGPAVEYNAAPLAHITGFGSSGMVAGTFRAIPPN